MTPDDPSLGEVARGIDALKADQLGVRARLHELANGLNGAIVKAAARETRIAMLEKQVDRLESAVARATWAVLLAVVSALGQLAFYLLTTHR